MAILPRWIGFKCNLGYCQMQFGGYSLMAHPLLPLSCVLSLSRSIPGGWWYILLRGREMFSSDTSGQLQRRWVLSGRGEGKSKVKADIHNMTSYQRWWAAALTDHTQLFESHKNILLPRFNSIDSSPGPTEQFWLYSDWSSVSQILSI